VGVSDVLAVYLQVSSVFLFFRVLSKFDEEWASALSYFAGKTSKYSL